MARRQGSSRTTKRERDGDRRLGGPGTAIRLRPGDPLEVDPDPLGLKDRPTPV